MPSAAKSQGSAPKDPPHKALPTEGGSLPFAPTLWPAPLLSWLLYRTHLSLQGPEQGARFVQALTPVPWQVSYHAGGQQGPSFPTAMAVHQAGAEGFGTPALRSRAGVSPQVVQMYKESPKALRPPAPRAGGLRWGLSPTLPQSFARVTTSMTVALHPPPLPGAYIHPASDEPPWSPAATLAANGSSNLPSRGPCPAPE